MKYNRRCKYVGLAIWARTLEEQYEQHGMYSTGPEQRARLLTTLNPDAAGEIYSSREGRSAGLTSEGTQR